MRLSHVCKFKLKRRKKAAGFGIDNGYPLHVQYFSTISEIRPPISRIKSASHTGSIRAPPAIQARILSLDAPAHEGP
jgi:hypothetical protein